MECPDYRLRASMFIDDELPEEDHRAFFRHLGECDACWTFFRRIEILHDALAEGERRTPEPETRALLQRHIDVPVATIVLTVFLALMTGVLFTLSIVASDKYRTIDEVHYGYRGIVPPQAVVSGAFQGTKP